MLEAMKFRPTVLDTLNDHRLFRPFAYVGGKWCAAESAATIQVNDPATGELIGAVPDLGVLETERAVDAAAEALAGWRALLPQARARRLREWHDLMLDNREDLARIMTLEQGKPLAEARGEIDYAASFLEWYAEEAKRLNGETITSHLPARQMTSRREPLGIVACVTPWNFPSAMITRKAAAALAAGCVVVARPASETPFSALALAELAERAGVPPGAFSVVTGDARTVVGALNRDPRVRAISFTGSTEIGARLISESAPTVKRMSMELGGHAPFILFPDVDLEEAVEAAVAAKFQTTGQDCLAANRLYVHSSIYAPFLERFVKRVKTLRVGNGFDEATKIGPLMHGRAIEKCAAQVADAQARGARLMAGGTVDTAGELFYQPTVLADVTPDMAISAEETFGPVAAVASFDDESEAIARANATEYGLVAYLYTHDHDRICRMTQALEYGMVAVNCVKVTGAPVPFGGVKQSGLGREGGLWGIEEFTEVKYVCAAYRAA